MPKLLIGEFAGRCGLSASALRFYDECGLLVPAGVDPVSGYRLYEHSQQDMATLIRDLRGAGMALAQVKEFLASQPPRRRQLFDEHMQAVSTQTAVTRRHIQQLQKQLNPTEMHMTETIDVDATQLRHGLQHMIKIASRDPEQPLLQTVLLEAAEGSLRLVATDRHRLALRDLAVLRGTTTGFSALVPAASAQRAVDVLRELGAATLSNEAKILRITQEDSTVDLPTVAAEFVDYASLLEADESSHVLIASHDDVLRLLEPSLECESIVLTFAPGVLVVDGNTATAAYDGRGITLHVNPRYLLDALAAAAGPDIAIEASTELRPITIRSADTGTSAHLLMPIKIDADVQKVVG